MGNTLKTMLLLVVLAFILIWIGGAIGGPRGAVVAFVIALALNGISYWYSDRIVLRMYRAQEIDPGKMPELYRTVKELSSTAGIKPPRLFYTDVPVPNAFATGRDPEHAVLCVTKGAIDLLEEKELRAVMAHEIGHVKDRDTLIMTVTVALASAVMMLSYMARWAAIFGGFSRDSEDSGGILALVVMSIVAPLAALLVQMAVSRAREYAADARGASISGDPESLARALEHISNYAKRSKFNAPPQTASLFIVNPFKPGFVTNLFSTHPPVEERAKRLRSMEL